jgi:hypothetical protein
MAVRVEDPKCRENRLINGGYAVSLKRLPYFTPRNIFWYSLLLEAE